MTRQTEKFIKGTLILTIAGLIAKILSAAYRIPLTNIVGSQGIGIYDTVYPIYSLLVAASLVGVPNAVSKMVADQLALGNEKEANHVFKMALRFVLILGVTITLILLFGANFIAERFEWDSEIVYLLYGYAISPIFVSIAGAIRGYFQGMQRMKYTAVSQVMDSFAKVVVGLLLVNLLIGNQTLTITMTGAVVGASSGMVLSSLYLMFMYRKETKSKSYIVDYRQHTKEDNRETIKKIALLTVPITIVSAAYSIMNAIDSATLFHIFKGLGYSKEYVNDIITQRATSFTVVNVPLTISLALAMSVVPAIAQAHTKKDYKERNHKIEEGIKLSMLFALPAACGIIALAGPILIMLYKSTVIDPMFLVFYAICLVFMILGFTIASTLQGMGKQYIPIISIAVAIVIKLALNFLLMPYFQQGYGMPISSLVYYMTYVGINTVVVFRITKLKMHWYQNVIKPLVASVIMGLIAYGSYQVIHSIIHSNAFSTLMSVLIGGLSYVIVLVLLRTLTEEDLHAMPKGERLVALFKKYRLLRK